VWLVLHVYDNIIYTHTYMHPIMSQSFACVTITVSLSASDVKLLWVDVTGAFADGAPNVFWLLLFLL
jgi:hypothetical protein